ncbi:MAG: metal-dependent hydrolase [Pseudomonadota bacterium]
MDPVCHTLVGASLGCTGLQRKSRYSRATLMIAANLPDIDVVAQLMGGTASYAFRRGVTHGIPALIVLPFLLTLAVMGWHRWRGQGEGAQPFSARWIYILSAIGVWSHPTLDWLNTYGMRWLMPIFDQWYYGDTLFIVDWVLWVVLAAGLVASRGVYVHTLAWYVRPSTLALFFLVGYASGNFSLTQLAERRAIEVLADRPPMDILASPVPFNPLRREVILEYPDHYRFADYNYAGRTDLVLREQRVEKGDTQLLKIIASTRDGRWFMHWVRFPYVLTTQTSEGWEIKVVDARYVPDIDNPRLDGFAVFAIDVPALPDASPLN